MSRDNYRSTASKVQGFQNLNLKKNKVDYKGETEGNCSEDEGGGGRDKLFSFGGINMKRKKRRQTVKRKRKNMVNSDYQNSRRKLVQEIVNLVSVSTVSQMTFKFLPSSIVL